MRNPRFCSLFPGIVFFVTSFFNIVTAAQAESIQQPPNDPIRPIKAADLETDAAIFYDVLKTLHPGIYRYSTPAEFDRRYAELRRSLESGATLDQAFLIFTRFAAAIRCGHTWTNPLNQPPEVAGPLLQRADRLPLHFSVIGKRFLITAVVPNSAAQRNDEIIAIDHVPVAKIISRLWPYLRADGASDGKRLAQIGHDGGQSAFDIYYSLIDVPKSGFRTLTLKAPGENSQRTVTLPLMAESAREQALKQSGGAPSEDWSYRQDGDIGIISMPTWAFWNSKFDWAAWLEQTFADLHQQQVRYLIIDLRRNEGGDGAIGDALLRRLASTPKTYASHVPHLVYDVVPQRLRPYLSTWSKSFYDQRPRIESLLSGEYTLRDRDPDVVTITPSRDVFSGQTFVLTGPNNSSAAFEFARIAKETRLATLIGQSTGGNLCGITGGNMFFLKLPNTGISIDIPVIAWKPRQPQPDSPLSPDVPVAPDIAAVAQGIDPDMQRAYDIIRTQNIEARTKTDTISPNQSAQKVEGP